jgi:hypothetical protein
MPVLDLALRLTLLDVLLRPVGNFYIRPLVLSLAVVGLLRSAWLRHPLLWLGLAVLLAARVLLDWPLADNHAYLLAYWCLAIALACFFRDPDLLAENARWLIAGVFTFACLWKFILSGNYADATFFKYIFIVDPRFEGLVRLTTGLDAAQLAALTEQVEAHRHANLPRNAIDIPQALVMLAQAATTWNLFINGALAVSFCLPAGPRLTLTRHLLLLSYCIITYAIATVDGFAWLLLAMGCALCSDQARMLRAGYVAVFLLIVFYREVPWAELLMAV